eukprot:TRINITY_DN3971_c1_g1_i1.p1 TRINITY_DN3971_c1_g1~~TRINITY_DN3971_c1_g1_i1.p1  ORF type:complete len:672 (-),score=139.97 TRINITY_DN3971_c1_g1_i1:797-2812(-)
MVPCAFFSFFEQRFFWSVLDAWGKLPPGLFNGNYFWLGAYWECKKLDPAVARSCTIANTGANLVLHNSFQIPMLLKYFNSTEVPIPFALATVCVPVSCNSTNFLPSILEILNGDQVPIQLVQFSAVNTNLMSCYCEDNPEPQKLSSGAIFVIFLLCLLASVGIVCSVLDEFFSNKRVDKKKQVTFKEVSIEEEKRLSEPEENDAVGGDPEKSALLSPNDSQAKAKPKILQDPLWLQLIQTFSALRNAQKLMKVDAKENQFSCLEGIRVLSLWWVILGHTNQMLVYTPIVNRNDVVSMSQQTGFQLITNAVFSVDTFFVMSGFMAAYLMLPEIDKRKNFSVGNIFQIYFHRIWRITPTYLIILLFLRYVYVYMGHGPLWPVASQMTAPCGNWWRNLLYINNMFPDSEECVAWSWYLANDMQFFLVTPWLLWLWSRRPTWGIFACTLLLIASTLYCVIITVHYNLDTYWLGSMISGGAPDAASRGDYGNLIYRKPWARIQSYLIGVYAAVMHLRLGKRLVSSNLLLLFGWALSAICLTLPVFGLHREQLGDPLPVFGQVMYISFSRIAWSAAICFIIIVCANGKGAYLNDFLSMNFWVPFSRMALAAYLVHVILIAIFLGSWQVGFYFSVYTVVYLYFSNLVATYALAFPLTILIESPLRLVEKLKVPRKNYS